MKQNGRKDGDEMDREKVIKGLEVCTSIEDGESCPKECPYYQDVCYGYDQLMRDALDLLKEQEDLGKELENAIELIHKKNARIEILKTVLEEQPQVVRCKDCKHWTVGDIGTYCPYHHDARPDWFCADGVNKDE